MSASDVALITIGQTATITVHGQVHNLGRLGGVMQSVHSTLSGDLVVADNMLKLISVGTVIFFIGSTRS